jgi:hypothetical protein
MAVAAPMDEQDRSAQGCRVDQHRHETYGGFRDAGMMLIEEER